MTAARIDDYRIIAELARTPAMITYAAHHVRLQRPATVKLARVTAGARGEAALHEARMLSRLRHAGVPTLHACGVLADGRRWLAIEPIPPRSIATLPALSAADVVQLVRDVAAILDHAHAAGIAARVLRPDSIVPADPYAGERAMIVDWSDATFLGARAAVASPDPSFLAPELVRGAPADVRADVYALGAIAYRALAGVAPTAGGGALVPCAARCPDAPRGLTALVDRMIAPAPCDRPTSCAALGELARGALDLDADYGDEDEATCRRHHAELEIQLEAGPLLPRPRWTPPHGITPELPPSDELDELEIDTGDTARMVDMDLALPS